ncbi:MAG: histidine kinase, dimerization and phosphoacceptor region [Nocardioides sp.]|nr:histidine kinase, dimerization and phosphoacceptor region [Nocardioides sp.]
MDRPTPEEYAPPLTPWRHTWRVVGMLAVIAVAWGPMLANQAHHPGLLWLDLGCGAVAMVAVFFRRRWPVPVALLTGALSAVSGVAAGPAVLAAVSVATRRRLWQVALVGLVNVVAGQTVLQIQPVPGDHSYWLDLTVNAVFTAGVLGWGMYIGSRRELMYTLRHRAERAEAEQELRVAQARGTERARIAREMHDVLAHRISQISMHAGALGFREDLTADEMRASAAVIQEKAHEALTDLRGVLVVLRDTETGELLDTPQPTYADLPVLVAEARESGLHLDFQDLLAPEDEPVPDVVGRTLYRIVQEGITNARKHAPGALLTIRVSGSSHDGIDILLRNPLGFGATRTPGAGLGLVGLSERAQLRGGLLEHRRDGSTFVLHGWIPWAA